MSERYLKVSEDQNLFNGSSLHEEDTAAPVCEKCGADLSSEHGPKFPYSCPDCTHGE
jgi:tRNA(Ile2) C34 agmatinyltransferase TiaS